MDKGKLPGAVFVNLRKAFDTIGHATLISKLPVYCVHGKERAWFESYLFNRQQFVPFQGLCLISCVLRQFEQGPFHLIFLSNKTYLCLLWGGASSSLSMFSVFVNFPLWNLAFAHLPSLNFIFRSYLSL